MNQSRANKIRTNLENWTTTIFNVLSRLFITFLVLAVFVMVYKGLSNDHYLVQDFQVPGDFEDKGFSGAVLSRKVQDRVHSIKEYIGSSKKDSIDFEADLEPDLEVGLMGFGLSLNTVTFHLKSLLGRKNKIITGELTDLNNKMQLTVRMSEFKTENFTFEYKDNADEALDYLLEESAKMILKNTDPYRMSIYYYRKKDYPKALNIVMELLKKENDQEWAYIAWGNILSTQGKKGEAIEKFEKAIEIKPNFELPIRNIAWKYFEMNEFDQAITYFKRVVELNPKGWNGLNGLAQSFRYSEKNEEASTTYDRLIEANPDLIWGYFNKAQFMFNNLKDTVGAITLYQTAAKIGTDGPEKYFALAGFYDTINNIEKCHEYLDKILEIQPDNVSVKSWKTSLYYYADDYEKAFTYLEDMRKISNESFGDQRFQKQGALNVMAMASYKMKNYQQALQIVKESIAVYPESGMPYTTLAETYSFMGNDEQFYVAIEEAFKRGVQPKVILGDDAYLRFENKKRFKALVKKYQKKQEPLDQLAKN